MADVSKSPHAMSTDALKHDPQYNDSSSENTSLVKETKIRRIFGRLQIFFFALTFMSSWEVMAINVSAVFWNGGPQSFAWGILVVIFGALAQAASLAEMASMLPIAGAQYHWTDILAPPRYKRIITWFQGWMTWFGWISLLCGVANITAVMIQNLAYVNNPSYVPERWHVTLIIYAMCIPFALVNQYAFWTLPWTEVIAGALHLIMFIILITVLLATATKHSAKFVFLEQATASGWTNKYVSWNLGLLTPTWGFVGFDGAVHLSEEVRKSRNAIPRTMFWSLVINAVLAYAMTIVILFTMGNLDDVLSSSFPISEICIQATGSVPAATALIVGLLIISLAVTLGSIASLSRLTWAWARDGALPMWFAHLSPNRRLPTRAVWLPVFMTMLLALLNIASTSAFGAILALSELGLYTSYMIAISCMLYARLQPVNPNRDTDRSDSISNTFDAHNPPWSLGVLGVPVNIFALLYSLYICVWLPFPTTLPVTGLNMNYAGPIYVLCVLFTLVSWLVWGKKHWRGVRKDIVRLVNADSDRVTKEL